MYVICSPRPPKPFIPSFDQLRISARSKDNAIEHLLRPKRSPLPTSLPPEDEAQVEAFLSDQAFRVKCGRETVVHKDLQRLRPCQWLNDEIINFYGALIMARWEAEKKNRVAEKENRKKSSRPGHQLLDVHYFSTFFWTKLVDQGYEMGRLAKWTKMFDIFAKDVVVMAVNHSNSHWTAAAINFRKKRFESYDSMGFSREAVFRYLRVFIDTEHRLRKKQPFDFTGWEDYTLSSTPQQENGYDCGVFTCQFMESLSRGEESFNFTQSNMPYLRKRMIWEIGNTKLRDD
ncbi:cysteine proteinase [Gloeophyllum trabeum ATCC 11539]|uniref:Cysteine proteinase n=1 Tax=Gloeophyllum trabeum (strain ATCC 11539 / FP-39264 / Madison 617) TaxID=670483 RepID=S7QN63_GLOTA|nr:cysteine proteinase [Gloeophyllum trabeum ATCC 11539]EPQ60948.1 cysteine proteinase [Gloeophyllum trabeum ATCC 11539]